MASILFILGLRGLSHPESARRGMHLAEFGMLMAIVGTLLHQEIVSYEWIIAGLLLGSSQARGSVDLRQAADNSGVGNCSSQTARLRMRTRAWDAEVTKTHHR